MTFPGLEIWINHRKVLRNGKEIYLNHEEFTVLTHMARRPGQVFSKEQLYAAARGEEYFCPNAIPNAIYRIRRKLEPDPRHPIYIKTVIGTGYKFEIPVIEE